MALFKNTLASRLHKSITHLGSVIIKKVSWAACNQDTHFSNSIMNISLEQAEALITAAQLKAQEIGVP